MTLKGFFDTSLSKGVRFRQHYYSFSFMALDRIALMSKEHIVTTLYNWNVSVEKLTN
jgi:hypothetical protein